VHVLAVVALTAPAALSLGAAFGVDAPLFACSHVLDRGAQAGAQTVACGDANLPQQEKNTRQISRRTEKLSPASSAHRQGTSRGDVLSKSLGHYRSLAA